MSAALDALGEAAAWWSAWLSRKALPLWGSLGADRRHGLFHEGLTPQGAPLDAPRRALVQARQSFVFARAAGLGFGAHWAELAWRGMQALFGHYRRADGLFVRSVDAGGEVLDPSCRLYDQAFALFAMAALHRLEPARMDLAAEAERTRRSLDGLRHAAGGFREPGPLAFQSNAHMHLLESALAWEAAGGGEAWPALSDEIVDLALTRFIDPDGGFLREFFQADWRPASGDHGRWLEPGHQFEWAWLLDRWAARRTSAVARASARRLFVCGLAGLDPGRGVAINLLWDDLTPRDAGARLWPQTEFLKAAIRLGETGHAATAARAMRSYVDTPLAGAWRDMMRADGGFVEEPAPASSFYHIMMALAELFSVTGEGLDEDRRAGRAAP